VNKWAVERLCVGDAVPEGYVRIHEAFIHESARLHASARFLGPVLIGPQCRIEEDAMIIGPTSIGADCVVGRQAVVSRSVLWTSCRVGAGAVLDHCILTDVSTVGEEDVLRETACLTREPRWTWPHWLKRVLPRRRGAAASVSTTGLALPVPSRPKPPSVVIRSDVKRVSTAPAASTVREGDC